MVIKQEQDPKHKDIEVLITYPEKNKTVDHIVSFLSSIDEQIECHTENGVKRINVSDIYYIESVDKKAVVFCEKNNYRTKYRLYQLYEKLSGKGFVQISNYCIMNIHKLDSIKPLFNSRMEVTLINGVHLYVNRNYIDGIEKKLMENG